MRETADVKVLVQVGSISVNSPLCCLRCKVTVEEDKQRARLIQEIEPLSKRERERERISILTL